MMTRQKQNMTKKQTVQKTLYIIKFQTEQKKLQEKWQ